MPVEALLNPEPGVPASLARARVLVSVEAPELATGESVRADLSGPLGERLVQSLELTVVADRLHVLVDARELSPGAWRLQLRWSDVAGRERGSRSYDLRLK